MLIAAIARRALSAGVDDDANRRNIASLESFNGGAGAGDATDNLVPGHHRIRGLAPLVAHHVQIGMAHAAIENLELDLRRARFAT